jgi:DNA repair exonuclease SbcCD ATPase subunit
VIVVDLMDDEKYQVLENQGSILFNSDDLFEGRLIPYKGQYYFTDHFCYHPKPTVGFILSKIKNLKTTEKEALAKEKLLQKAIVSPQKSLKKITDKLKKVNGKLAGTTKEKKIQSLKEEIAKLEDQKAQLESQISDIENQLTELRTQIIEGEHRQNRFNFIRKLSYMSLKWERSRQIDVRDIYQD